MDPVTLVAGNTGSILQFTVKDFVTGALLPDIASAMLRWRIDGAETIESVMNVDPVMSIVSYQFEANELTPGTLRAEVEVIDSSGGSLTSREVFSCEVRDSL